MKQCTNCGSKAIGKASTITSASSNQRLSTNMSIDDADQLTNNTAAVEPFNVTILSHLTVDENSQTPKQREDHSSRQVDLITSQRATGLGFKFGLTSGFSDPVFGQTSTPSQHSSFTSGSSPRFDNLASNFPSFGDLAKSGGTAFCNDTSFATSPFGTSNQLIRVFGSDIWSDKHADRLTNNKTVDAPNKTVSTNLTNDGNYQNLKQSGDKSQGREISTNITTLTKGTTNFESTFGTPVFCRPVLRPSDTSKRDSSSSRSEGADGIPGKVNVGQNVLATTQVISDAASHALFGNQGAKSFRSNGSSQTASFPGGKFSSESIGGVGYLGFGISQNQEQSASEFCSRADGYYRQVDPTTNTTTTQGVNRFTSGFAQPKFGQAANPHQQASCSNPRFESLVQASDLQSFGDLAQSSGSTLGSASTLATPTFGTSGFENPSGLGGSTFGSGPSFTGYRS